MQCHRLADCGHSGLRETGSHDMNESSDGGDGYEFDCPLKSHGRTPCKAWGDTVGSNVRAFVEEREEAGNDIGG